MNEGYMLEPMTPEQKKELLEMAIKKTTQNGTWPMLLAAIGIAMGSNNKEK